MSRFIDADDLEIYRERFDTYDDYSMVFDMIDSAPTIDVNPKWIPVNERLPENKPCEYLVTTKCGDVEVGFFNTFWTGNIRYWLENYIAWMPFPESYKENENG